MEYVFLCLVAAAGGAINSIAGGGTLLTFPALFAVLRPLMSNAAVVANATSTVALFPGSIAGAWAYRKDFQGVDRWLYWLFVPSAIGGIAGALLVARADPKVFEWLVPFLVLTAAFLFALQPYIAKWTGIGQPHRKPTRAGMVGVLFFQLLVAFYGGYFGAGIGILMLAALAMIGMSDIHEMNALKSILAAMVNGTGVVVFVLEQKVHWPIAVPMLLAGIAGGYGGAFIARRTNRVLVRRIVTAIGFILSAYYFYQQFWR